MRSTRLGRGRAVGFDVNVAAGYRTAREVNAQSLTISGSRAKSLGGASPVAPSPIAPSAGPSGLPSNYAEQVQGSFSLPQFGGIWG